MFSKACQYAIRATVYIATHSKEEVNTSLKAIAKEINSPEAYTAKILQQLVKNNIINSIQGPKGGFSISRSQQSKIKLSQIVYAIDGDSIYKGCGLGLPECSKTKPCPVHEKFMVIRTELKRMLETTKLNELTPGIVSGLTFLKR